MRWWRCADVFLSANRSISNELPYNEGSGIFMIYSQKHLDIHICVEDVGLAQVDLGKSLRRRRFPANGQFSC